MNFDNFWKTLTSIYNRNECRLLWLAYQDFLNDNEKQHISIQEFTNRLIQGIPYQHILGKAEFYGELFYVNRNTLIPRPETEELIEFSISMIKQKFNPNLSIKILEIGTGTGIISILLKKKFPLATVVSMDISVEAIEIAKKNAQFHDTDIHFRCEDYLHWQSNEKFDVIISNPPYIGQDEKENIEDNVLHHDPHLALFSPTDDPLVFYKKIALDGMNILSKNGIILLEINQIYGQKTQNLFYKYTHSKLIKDLSGNDRILYIEK